MTNPTYTDEQVIQRIEYICTKTTGDMLRSLLADRQRLQADCITYLNHVAELQEKVKSLQAEVEAFRDIPRTIQRYDVDTDGGGPYMLHHGDYVLHSDLVDAFNTARVTLNETKEAKS